VRRLSICDVRADAFVGVAAWLSSHLTVEIPCSTVNTDFHRGTFPRRCATSHCQHVMDFPQRRCPRAITSILPPINLVFFPRPALVHVNQVSGQRTNLTQPFVVINPITLSDQHYFNHPTYLAKHAARDHSRTHGRDTYDYHLRCPCRIAPHGHHASSLRFPHGPRAMGLGGSPPRDG